MVIACELCGVETDVVLSAAGLLEAKNPHKDWRKPYAICMWCGHELTDQYADLLDRDREGLGIFDVPPSAPTATGE